MTRDRKSCSSPPRRRTLGERGAIAVQTAVILVVLLAMVSLGVEITLVLVKHRQMQTAADAASMAGAAALNISASADTEARAVAAQHGFINGQNSAVVTINNPPLAGPHVSDSNYVEAIISQPQVVTLAKLLHPGDFDVGARAVASRLGSGPQYCILAKDLTAAKSVDLANNVVLANTQCGVASNSSSSSAINLKNNASITGPVSSHGGIARANGASTPGTPVVTGGPILVDPYASLALPTFSGTCGGVLTGGSHTPGCYSGINTGNSSTLTLAPGVYYIRGNAAFGNQSTLNATLGVTIVIDGNFNFLPGNGTHINITAPTSGVWSGLGLMGWSTNSTGITQTFNNNANINIVGAIYFPSQIISFSNNVVTSASRCTQVIGRILQFSNNVTFNYNCTGVGILPIVPPGAKLAE